MTKERQGLLTKFKVRLDQQCYYGQAVLRRANERGGGLLARIIVF